MGNKLLDAHKTSEQLREALVRELPEGTSINIHLEARDLHVLPAVGSEQLTADVEAALRAMPDGGGVSSVNSYLIENGSVVALTCNYPGDTPLSVVHDRMAHLENVVRAHVPSISRLHVDPDPPERGEGEGRS